MKHTQGIWEADGHRINCKRARTTSLIAEVHDIAMSPVPPFNYDREQAIANAKLMAAGPELLSELEDARMSLYSTEYDKVVKHYGGEGSKVAADMARKAALNRVRSIDAAIKKATE